MFILSAQSEFLMIGDWVSKDLTLTINEGFIYMFHSLSFIIFGQLNLVVNLFTNEE